MKLHHIIESQQFDRVWLENDFFPLTQTMKDIVAEGGSNDLAGTRMISFFYEPSTRTRARFEIAMDMLGGRVVFSTENAREFSSVAKGETLPDTIRVLNHYRPHAIVLRCDEEGGAKIASEFSSVPIINAGDGPGQHPTQSLLDIFTIKQHFGKIDGVSIAMVGDLARGRTVRSLAYLLAKFSGVKIYFVAPDVVAMRDDVKDYLERHGVWFSEEHDLRKVAPEVDVIYQTRIQKERGGLISRYNSTGIGGFYIVNQEIVSSMRSNAIIMHPLPRNEEITLEVDEDPRAIYLEDQVDSGLFTAMALLKMILT